MLLQSPDLAPNTYDTPLSVLVAEDNFANQLVAKTLLVRAGYSVMTVDNGREAVRAATQNSFDVILMDVEMPEMNGIEATEAIRELPGPNQNTKIIALTAYGSPAEKYTYKHSGIDATLSKPFQMARLAEALLGHAKSTPRQAQTPSKDHTQKLPHPQAALAPPQYEKPSAPKPQTDIAPLDLITINLLLTAAGPEGFASVIKAYWRSAYALLSDIQSANEVWDRDRMQRAAHALKGASMNVGMLQVSRIAEQLQNAPPDCVPEFLDTLGTTMVQARKALLAHLKEMR